MERKRRMCCVLRVDVFKVDYRLNNRDNKINKYRVKIGLEKSLRQINVVKTG